MKINSWKNSNSFNGAQKEKLENSGRRNDVNMSGTFSGMRSFSSSFSWNMVFTWAEAAFQPYHQPLIAFNFDKNFFIIEYNKNPGAIMT